MKYKNMKNSTANYLANMFLMKRKFKNCYDLRDRFVLFYYYELDPSMKNKVDIGSLWGTVYREWEKL
jgi:hypothetical protein